MPTEKFEIFVEAEKSETRRSLRKVGGHGDASTFSLVREWVARDLSLTVRRLRWRAKRRFVYFHASDASNPEAPRGAE